MAIQRVLAPTSGRYSPNDPENLDRPAIQAGLRVVELFKARLDVLSVVESERTIKPEWMGWLPGHSIDPLLNEIARQGRVRRKHARSIFDTVVKDRPQGPQAEFTEAEGSIPDIVGTFGRLSDLIVLANSEARWGMPKRPILETVLWQTGRPASVGRQRRRGFREGRGLRPARAWLSLPYARAFPCFRKSHPSGLVEARGACPALPLRHCP